MKTRSRTASVRFLDTSSTGASVRALIRAIGSTVVCAVALSAGDLQAQDARSTAGRAVAKRFAELGRLPDPAAIAIEDIVNYHRHRIPLPRAGESVALDLRWDAPLPAHSRESVLQIGFSTPRVHDAGALRPLNLALVIDRSGSMADDDKMARVKQGLSRFVRRLRPTDRVAIIGYSDEAQVLLPSQEVGDRRRVLDTIRRLEPSGYTNLHSGLMRGYEQVYKFCERDAHHRVILLTDGRANRGVTDVNAVARDSKRFNDKGIDLSTIGVGKDFNQELLAGLAKTGRGLFHFVADEADIQKVFVQEAQSLIGIVARVISLEVTHGKGMEVARIYGYWPKRIEHGFTTPLENFNSGMTGVVMVKFRARDRGLDREGEGSFEGPASVASRVRVRLRYTDASSGKRVTLEQKTRFLDPQRGDSRGDAGGAAGATDHEVRKNFTIAVMARATRRMAECAKASQYGEAERTINAALRFYRSHYPRTEDPDLRHNADVLKKYKKVLSDRIERFRRL